MLCWEKWFLILMQVHLVTCYFKPIQMKSNCGKSLSILALNTYGIDVSLRSSTGSAPASKCSLVIENRVNQDHFHVNIIQVSIISCTQANLHLAERITSRSNNVQITPDICGSSASRYVNVSYTTSRRYLVIEYDVISATNNWLKDSFRIAVNSYKKSSRYSSCRSDEYKCSNYRCINDDLKCQRFNPCGDGSDCKHKKGNNSTGGYEEEEQYSIGQYILSSVIFIAFCVITYACFKSKGNLCKKIVECITGVLNCISDCSCALVEHVRTCCRGSCEFCDRCRPRARDCCTSAGNQCGAIRGRCGELLTGACACCCRCTCCGRNTVQDTQPTSSASVSYISNSESVRDIPVIPDEPPPEYEPPEPSAPPVYSNAIMNPPDYSAYAKDDDAPPPDYDTVVANNTRYMPRRNSR